MSMGHWGNDDWRWKGSFSVSLLPTDATQTALGLNPTICSSYGTAKTPNMKE